MTDPYVGKLTFIRVYSGRLKAGERVLNTTQRQDRADRPHPADARERPRGARGARRRRHRGDRRPQVHDDRRHVAPDSSPIVLEAMSFPDPVISVADRAQDEGRPGQARAGAAAAGRGGPDVPRVERRGDRADASSPGWASCTSRSSSTGSSASSTSRGNVGRPQVAYRETITKPAEKIRGKFVRQTGGSGQYGDVLVNVYPNKGEGYEFVDKIVGGRIPKEYIPAVDQGIEEA